jgi:hypothetical protein
LSDKDKVGPNRIFRNFETDERILGAETAGEVIEGDLDENDVVVNASNRTPKEEFNKMLKDKNMKADENTGFTFSGGKWADKKEKSDNL